MDVAALDIGSRTVPVPVAHVLAVSEDPGDEARVQFFSTTAPQM